MISDEMLAAGVGFNARFRVAQLNPLRAQNLEQPIHSTPAKTELAEHRLSARDFVASRIAAVGGVGSLPGSVCWEVLGLEKAVSRWAVEKSLNYHRRVDDHEARGILLSVLTTLSLDPVSRIWRPRYRPNEPAGPGFAAILSSAAPAPAAL